MRELALFAGAGGGLLGSKLLGWNTVCAVEIDPYCRNVLLQRQVDGCLDKFPIWDDIRTFDGKPWRGHVDVISGGFPCQDISSAGTGKGLAGSRSGLWFEMLRIISEAQPTYVFAENSPHLRTRGLGTVVKEITCLGYDVRWGVLGAWHVGAPHRRNRMWIVAKLPGKRRRSGGQGRSVTSVKWQPKQTFQNSIAADTNSSRKRVFPQHAKMACTQKLASNVNKWWGAGSISGVDDGVAHRMDRVRATGNGQVPAVAALAWKVLTAELSKED